MADDFYLTTRWRRFRAWYLGEHPLCEICQAEGRTVPAVIVDHIHELKDGGAPYDESNAMSLCAACHNKKTASVKNHRKVTGNNRRRSRTHTYPLGVSR